MGQYDMYFKNEVNNFFNKNFSIWKKSITFAPEINGGFSSVG
jgi:hypothetical protein